jgi:hypothetical protein
MMANRHRHMPKIRKLEDAPRWRETRHAEHERTPRKETNHTRPHDGTAKGQVGMAAQQERVPFARAGARLPPPPPPPLPPSPPRLLFARTPSDIRRRAAPPPRQPGARRSQERGRGPRIAFCVGGACLEGGWVYRLLISAFAIRPSASHRALGGASSAAS